MLEDLLPLGLITAVSVSGEVTITVTATASPVGGGSQGYGGPLTVVPRPTWPLHENLQRWIAVVGSSSLELTAAARPIHVKAMGGVALIGIAGKAEPFRALCGTGVALFRFAVHDRLIEPYLIAYASGEIDAEELAVLLVT